MKDKRFGIKINQRRKEAGLTAEDLADICHVKPGYMRQILCGTIPSQQVILSICKALNITTDYIFEVTGDGKDSQLLERIYKLSPRQKDLLICLLDSYFEFDNAN